MEHPPPLLDLSGDGAAITGAANGAAPVAYLLGARYPRFAGVPRDAFADTLARHGFTAEAKRAAERDPRRDAGMVVSRWAARPTLAAPDGRKVAIRELPPPSPDVRVWGVYAVADGGAERAQNFTYGARIVAAPGGVYAAPPVDAAPDAGCEHVAAEVAAEAAALLDTADTAVVSRLLASAVEAAGALGFVSRGSYCALPGRPAHLRLVALYRELRQRFYDPGLAAGIRCNVVGVPPSELAAVADAHHDDVTARLAELCERIDGAVKARAGTLTGLRDQASALADEATGLAALLGSHAERYAARARDLRDRFNGALAGIAPAMPDWAAEGDVVVADQSAAPDEAPADEAPTPPAGPPGPPPPPSPFDWEG
jgi:hypothetical protein